MQVVANGQVVNYQKTGHGKCLILVHGWDDSSATFDGLQNSLSKRYTVISLDLPGFGKSEVLNGIWGLDDYAGCVASFVSKLDVDVYAYIGHSNGGAILIYGLAHQLLSANRLVLLASAGIRDTRRVRKQLLRLTAKSGKLATGFLPDRLQKTIKQRFYKTIGSELMLVPNLESTFKKIVGYDVKSDAAKLRLPTLLIYGDNDLATPIQFGKTFNDLIKDSRLELLDNAGHFVHHDQPDRTINLIEAFLK